MDTIDLWNLTRDCGSKPSRHKGGHARRLPLIDGYKRVIATLYDPTLENYFTRCLTLFRHLKPVRHLRKPKSRTEIDAAFMVVRRRLSAPQLPAYTKFIAKVSKDYPAMLPDAIYLAAMGYHFEK